jgi:hypothetical protein
MLPLIGALAFGSGCSGGDKGDTQGADTGMLDGGGPLDTGATPDTGSPHSDGGSDAGGPDATPNYDFGAHLSADGTIVGISLDEKRVYYHARGRLFSVSSTGGAAVDRGVAPDEWYTRPIGTNLWMTFDLASDPKQGTLRTLRETSTTTPMLVAPHVLRASAIRSDDTERAVFAANLQSIGTSSTATLTADLVSAYADGTHLTTLIHGFHVGPFDATAATFAGPCEMRGAFTSSTTAMIALCKDPHVPGPKTLFFVDVARGTVHTVGENALDFLRAGGDGTFALYRDGNLHIQGFKLRDLVVEPLMEMEPTGGPRILDKNRFLYFTNSGVLRVSSFPAMIPTTILDGVRGLNATSPSGGFALYFTLRSPSGLTDLNAISTSTATNQSPIPLDAAADALAGDAPFTDDSAYALWFSAVDANGVGAIMSRNLASGSTINMLGPSGYRVLTYADATQVMMLMNVQVAGNRITGDLAITKVDGSSPAITLATGVDANRLYVFPKSRDHLLYHVPAGTHAGIWVRALAP